MADPMVDFAGQEEYLAQLLKEALLKKHAQEPTGYKGVGGGYIRPGIGRQLQWAVEKEVGDRQAEATRQQVLGLRQQQLDMAQRLGEELTTPGSVPMPEGQAGPPAPMDPLQENQRRMGVATRMSMLPMTKGLGTQVINQGIAFPEQMAKLQEQAEARKALAVQQGEDRRSIAELKTIEAMEKQRKDQEFKASQNALYRTLASVAGSNRNANADLDRQIKEMRLEEMQRKAVAPPKASAAEVKAAHEAALGVANIDAALEALERDPKAVGPQYMVPGAELAGQYMDPEGIKVRALVSNVGSQKLHDRSGAAVTISEFPRLRPFIPGPSDTAEGARVKLQALKEEYARMQQEWAAPLQGRPSAAPNPSAWDADKKARYEAWKAGRTKQ